MGGPEKQGTIIGLSSTTLRSLDLILEDEARKVTDEAKLCGLVDAGPRKQVRPPY